MLWRKKEEKQDNNKVFLEITDLLKLLELRVTKLETHVDDLKVRLRKKFFPEGKEEKSSKYDEPKDPFDGVRGMQNFNNPNNIGL